MAVYINTVRGEPAYGSLPAAKILHYPLEGRDYRPFAQAQFALSADTFYFRLIAFEASPPQGSCMALILRGARPLSVEVWPPEEGRPPECRPSLPLRARSVGGEDLQGIYWGAECAVPLPDLARLLGKVPEPGGVLHGNVFKICPRGDMRHCGMLFPAPPVWSAEEAVALPPEGFGEMLPVPY